MKHLLLLTIPFCLLACKPDDMADKPHYKPLAPTSLFPNGASARLPVPHTVDRTGFANESDERLVKPPLSAGSAIAWHSTSPPADFPFPITRADLLRGQERFTIYCAPCHGLLGDGNGPIPDRGLTRPPTWHSD